MQSGGGARRAAGSAVVARARAEYALAPAAVLIAAVTHAALARHSTPRPTRSAARHPTPRPTRRPTPRPALAPVHYQLITHNLSRSLLHLGAVILITVQGSF